MHYIKPVWLTHGGERKDHEVYSCDVSPDGSRLVTAAGDGHVRIWSTEAIYNAHDPNYTKPKQLAFLNYHSGTIHTVRFSPNGRFLASGADDKIVCVYNLDPSPPSHLPTFGTNESPPVENWRIFRRLIGHDNDVQDLGWSHDSSILVSVGLDSKVVVWSGFTFEKLKTILSHQSHVKGITFDPANKYFATASDDRTVKIFRFTSPGPNSTAHDQGHNFILEKTITAPFQSSPLTTYFRRCSWSPDGVHIAAANAVNGPVSSVAIISRGSWDSNINLIGHEGPVEVCAFSPALYSPVPLSKEQDDPSKTIHPMTVIACAGQDKSLTIWLTSNPRPILITQDLAKNTISDLSWSPDGYKIFATSLDGSIVSIVFEEGEMGYALPTGDTEKTLAKYGANRKGTGIVEGPEGLILEEKSKAGELRGVEGRMGALMGDGSPKANGQATANGTVAPVANAQTADPTNGTPNQPNKDIPAENKDDLTAIKIAKLKQRVTITKDGRKRIAPLLVSSTGGAESSLPQTQLVTAGPQLSKNDVPQSILDLSRPFDGLPKGGLSSLLLGSKRKFAAVDGGEEAHPEKRIAAMQDRTIPILVDTPAGLVLATSQPPVNGQVPPPDFLRPAVLNPAITVSRLRLATPKVRGQVLQYYRLTPDEYVHMSKKEASAGDELVFEARNPHILPAALTHHNHEPTRISLSRKAQPLWLDFLPNAVVLASGNRHFWSAACEDGTIYVWTPAGRRMFNPFVLEAQPVILESFGHWLMAITSVGMCHVWNMQTGTSPHPPVSLAPVLDTAIHSLLPHPIVGPAITSARINSEGRIIVTLSNGDGFAYSPALYTWQRLSEMWWAVGSQYWNTTDTSVGDLSRGDDSKSDAALNLSAGIIPHLERSTTQETLARGRSYALQRFITQLLKREGFESFEASVSVGHLENRVAAALMLGAKQEFRIYLRMYAKRLGAEGLKAKVEELLRNLLADSFDNDDNDDEGDHDKPSPDQAENISQARNWFGGGAQLCGWSRKDLLKDAVLLIGKHRDLQRITVPYAKLLGITEGALATDEQNSTDVPPEDRMVS